MAKRSFSVSVITPTATADAAPLLDATHCGAMVGGSATQRNVISEIYLGGQAGASAPTIMVFGFNVIAGVTHTNSAAAREAPLDSASAPLSLPADVGDTTATDPQRSATLGHVLNLSFNAFGGIVRWLAAPGEEIGMVGLALDTGSISLSAFTGGTPGALGSHFIFETL